jgi:hypothetical protein
VRRRGRRRGSERVREEGEEGVRGRERKKWSKNKLITCGKSERSEVRSRGISSGTA